MPFGDMLTVLCGGLVAAPTWLVIGITIVVIALMWWGIGIGGDRRQ